MLLMFCSVRSIYLTLSATNVVTVTVIQRTARPSNEPANICPMSPVHKEKARGTEKSLHCITVLQERTDMFYM